jgi:hypothetical protein
VVPMGAPGQPERGPADKCRRTQTKEFRACSSQDEALARCDTRSGAVAGARDRTSDLVQPGAGGLRGDHDVIRRQRTLQLACNARLLGSDWARLSRALDVAEENKAVVRRFMSEVVGGGNLDVADEVLAPNYVNLAMGGPTSPASRRWSLPPLPWSKNSGSTTRS